MPRRFIPRKCKPVLVKPQAAQPELLPRPQQIGERWCEEYQFMARIFAPAHAAGDLEMGDDCRPQEES